MDARVQKGIKEEGNKANLERERQGVLHPVKIAPTKSEDQSTPKKEIGI